MGLDVVLLGDDSPLPLDRPFTPAEARGSGLIGRQLLTLKSRDLVREITRGVYAVVQLPDTIENRAAALALVVPASAVITDRTAAWLHGVDALPRSAPHQPVPIDVFSRSASRTRRSGVASGCRTLPESDLTTVHGLTMTTPLRTAVDLGRRLRREDAFAAMCGFLRSGLDHRLLCRSVERFAGQRGVVQLRELAPLVDGRPESAAEAILLLWGMDAGIGGLEPQWWVHSEDGVPTYRLDLAIPALRLAFEYQGVSAHSTDEQRAGDERRRTWLETRGWTIIEVWAADLFGSSAEPDVMMRSHVRAARRRLGRFLPQGEFLPPVC